MPIRWDDVVAQLEPGPGAGLYRPNPRRSVAGILPSALERLGLDPGPERSRLEEVPARTAGRRFRKMFFCLVDSLGLDDVLAHPGGLLARWLDSHGTWATTVFPSITSSAITSILHGVAPAAHGILGHKVWNSRVGRIVDMLTLKLDGSPISLPEAGVDVGGWTRTSPLVCRSVVGDLPCYHVSHKELLGSGLSNFVYPRNVVRIGYGSMIEGLSKVKRLLEREDRTVVSFYTGSVDATSHGFGKRSPEFTHVLGEVERGLAWIARELSPAARAETLFVLASDHGQCVFDPHKAVRLTKKKQDLYRSWTPHHGLGNSGRVLHLYGSGAPPSLVESSLAEDVGELGVVLGAEEAYELAGASPGSARERAGDEVGERVVVLKEGAWFDFEFPAERLAAAERNLDRLVSNHGSLTAEELLVPAIMGGLDELEACVRSPEQRPRD